MLKDVSLKDYTSFMVGGNADHFVLADSEEKIISAVNYSKEQNLPIFILGEGCNLLVSDEGFRGVVIKSGIDFIDIVSKDKESVIVQVGNGVIWDDFVEWAVKKEYWGIENLSLIPSSVGASPVQNIGAFGQEVADTITRVKAYDTVENKVIWLSNKECEFGYRSSVFNSRKIGRYVILVVEFKLSKIAKHCLEYNDLRKRFHAIKIKDVKISEIRDFLKELRASRLPDVKEIGNAGSFFKNAIIPIAKFEDVREKISSFVDAVDLTKFDNFGTNFSNDNMVKIPTAFLIEICGLKGYRKGNASVFDKHSLVLVNLGGATAKEIYDLAIDVKNIVFNKTGVEIFAEPMMLGFSEEEVHNLKG